MTKKEAVEVIKTYGLDYGFYLDDKKEVKFGVGENTPRFVNYLLVDAVESGDKEAAQVAEALDTLVVTDLRSARGLMTKNMKRLDAKYMPFARSSQDLLLRQEERYKNLEDIGDKILFAQNIYREATEEARRLTPLERARISGIEVRKEHANEALKKAISDDNKLFKRTMATKDRHKDEDVRSELNSNTMYGTGIGIDAYNNMKKVAQYYGIDFDGIVAKAQAQYGDPYMAIQKAFIEAGTMLEDARLALNSGDEDDEIEMALTDLAEEFGMNFYL